MLETFAPKLQYNVDTTFAMFSMYISYVYSIYIYDYHISYHTYISYV